MNILQKFGVWLEDFIVWLYADEINTQKPKPKPNEITKHLGAVGEWYDRQSATDKTIIKTIAVMGAAHQIRKHQEQERRKAQSK